MTQNFKLEDIQLLLENNKSTSINTKQKISEIEQIMLKFKNNLNTELNSTLKYQLIEEN